MVWSVGKEYFKIWGVFGEYLDSLHVFILEFSIENSIMYKKIIELFIEV